MDDRAFLKTLAFNRIRRWADPQVGEPAYGFLARIAMLHRQISLAVFARRVGIDGEASLWRMSLDALGACEFASEANLSLLGRWTPIIEDHSISISDEVIKKHHWSTRTRRYCSACLAENGYHRVWFDLTFMLVCPYHRIELTDKASDGSTLYWGSSDIVNSPRAGYLGKAVGKVCGQASTLESYVLKRIGLRDSGTFDHFLSAYPISDIADACEFVGRIALGGYRAKMPRTCAKGFDPVSVQDAGFAVLQRGKEAFSELALEISRDAPVTAFGVVNLFGWIAKFTVDGNELVRDLLRLLYPVAAASGRQGRWSPRLNDTSVLPKERYTIREAAEKLGLAPQFVHSIAGHHGLLLPHIGTAGHPFLIEETGLAAIKTTLQNGLSAADAARHLGLDRTAFAQMCDAGIVAGQKIPPTGRQTERTIFSPSELDCACWDRRAAPLLRSGRRRSTRLATARSLRPRS